MDLAGKVAIVTGAAKPAAIGEVVARGLAREGADVVVADLFEAGFADVTRSVEALGRRCVCIRTDVADPRAVEAMVEQAVGAFGRVDVLVNGVGGSWGITPEDLTDPPPRRGFLGLTNCSDDDWRTIVGVNLAGAFYAARAAAPYLQRQGGCIVNISSTAARQGVRPGSEGSSGPYAVAKAGIIGMTKQLALELGPYGVRVNCVAPGIILSNRGQRMLGSLPEERRAALPRGIPLGRFGTVEEVAELIVGLCCDETSYVTGATIDVNGGSYIA